MTLTAPAASPAGALDPTSLLRGARGLLVLHELGGAAPLRQLVALLEALAGERGNDAVAAYGALFRALAERALAAGERWPADGSQALATALADALLTEETVFSRWAERTGPAGRARYDGSTGDTGDTGDADRAGRSERTGHIAPASRAGDAITATLYEAAAADLRALQALVAIGRELPVTVARLAGLAQAPPWWSSASAETTQMRETPVGAGAVSGEAGATRDGRAGSWRIEEGDRGRWAVVERLVAAGDWGALVEDLAAYYAAHGSGLLAHYRAFRWLGADGVPAIATGPAGFGPRTSDLGLRTPDFGPGAGSTLAGFVPVPAPDSVRPGDLIGYQAERELLRRNTVHFLAGYPANNALLYGDRGTGKSSSVKALLHEQSRPGEPPDLWERLRMVEVPKARLADFPVLVEALRGRPQRFVVFVDDLSFEEGETQYKDMKAMLEGGLEARPANVVVYATSNRRHLVREQFADRTTPDSDEVHARDTVQEKLSFADRFGLTITFSSPDQAAYLAIVEGLARQRHLPIDPAALRARAIEWAAWHNGRSGRTARQFVDYLEGELRMKSEE